MNNPSYNRNQQILTPEGAKAKTIIRINMYFISPILIGSITLVYGLFMLSSRNSIIKTKSYEINFEHHDIQPRFLMQQGNKSAVVPNVLPTRSLPRWKGVRNTSLQIILIPSLERTILIKEQHGNSSLHRKKSR